MRTASFCASEPNDPHALVVTPTTNLAFTLVANSLNEPRSSSGERGTVVVVLVEVATAVVVDSTVVGTTVVVSDVDELEPQAAIRRLVPKTKVARRKRKL
jgi:hypothetical protein